MLTLKDRKLINLAIARGVKLLDRRRPAWFKRIKLDQLDLANPRFCVLGQVYEGPHRLMAPGFTLGRLKLGIFYRRGASPYYGFSIPLDVSNEHGPESYSFMTEQWARIIARKQRAAKKKAA
jgi:hypothetical protein